MTAGMIYDIGGVPQVGYIPNTRSQDFLQALIPKARCLATPGRSFLSSTSVLQRGTGSKKNKVNNTKPNTVYCLVLKQIWQVKCNFAITEWRSFLRECPQINTHLFTF